MQILKEGGEIKSVIVQKAGGEIVERELTHEARRVEIFYEDKKPVVLLTNNFDFSVEDVSEIYRLRCCYLFQISSFL